MTISGSSIIKCYFLFWLEIEYLLHTENGEQFKYHNYYNSYFLPFMETWAYRKHRIVADTLVYQCLRKQRLTKLRLKKIVGHEVAMTLTERIYTHLDI